MTENFDRAPGAGRDKLRYGNYGVGVQDSGGFLEGDNGDAARHLFSQREPLRQPRTSPPLVESSSPAVGDGRHTVHAAQDDSTLTINSTLSADAPEFYPSSFASFQEPVYDDGSEAYYQPSSLAELVQEFLWHLESSPGSFDLDMEAMTATLNEWVTTKETLEELVELIFVQSVSIPNFAYTGARLCNHLSHHLEVSLPGSNFRQLLLIRCQKEYERRDEALKGSEDEQKSFHAYVLFLGELYLNLEVKGATRRANILLAALKGLLDSLLSNTADRNLVCAVKLLKLTGSVLEDDWKVSSENSMDDVIQRIRSIQLDASCTREVKEMLLNLLELRSSNWGRVCSGVTSVDATPDNDPNYFMNEPTFYTADGTPFTAADPEYSEKYQEILDREEYCQDLCEENGTEEDYEEDDDGMDPEIEEAYEKFCLESGRQ